MEFKQPHVEIARIHMFIIPQFATTSINMFLRCLIFFTVFHFASCVVLPVAGSGRNGQEGVPNENHAASYPDFTEEAYNKRSKNKSVVMRYRVGDRFRLRQPMILNFSPSKVVYLCDSSEYLVPQIDEYRRNPSAYRFGGGNPYQVIKLVPAGTVIKIVKIAEIDYGAYPYFVIEGETNWFRSAAFIRNENLEYSSERIILEKGYKNEFFQKL